MALDSSKVLVAVTGTIAAGPVGTTLPTDAETAIDAAFVDLGFLDETGIRENASETFTTFKAWQNSVTVRQSKTEHIQTFDLVFLQTEDEVREIFYGEAPVTGTLSVKGAVSPERSWVFDIVDGADVFRIVVPRAQVTARSEVPYNATAPIAYGVTLTCYPETGTGDLFRVIDGI